MKSNLHDKALWRFGAAGFAAALLSLTSLPSIGDIPLTGGLVTHYDIVWDPSGARLFTTGFNGTDFDVFLTPGDGGPSSVFIGGAASQVVYDVNDNGDVLYTTEIGGTARLAIRNAAGGTTMIPGPVANDGSAQFSSDGSFVIYTERAAVFEAPVRLYRFDLPAGPRMPMADALPGDHLRPVLSPDDSTVAFLYAETITGPLMIYTVPASGMGPATPLTGGLFSHMDQVWSNDGSALACVRGPEEGPFELAKIEFPGGTSTTLAIVDGQVGRPAFSADDSKVIFTASFTGVPEVEILETPAAGGGGLAEIVWEPGMIVTLPTFKPGPAVMGTVLSYQRYGPGIGPQIWAHRSIACGLCADSNCDGTVGVSDIAYFVQALTGGQSAWQAAFPGGSAPCDFLCANDINADLLVSVSDIGGFVAVLTGGACPG